MRQTVEAYKFHIYVAGSKKHNIIATESVMAVQGRPSHWFQYQSKASIPFSIVINDIKQLEGARESAYLRQVNFYRRSLFQKN